MNEEKIRQLLHSPNIDDNILGVSFLGKLEDPRKFIRDNGELLDGQENIGYTHLGDRYTITRKSNLSVREPFYYRINEEYYILVDSFRAACECYDHYSSQTEVIE